MIEETARVIAVDDDRLLLEAQTRAACNACSARQGCGTSLLSRWVGRRFTRFSAHNSVNASVGDEVVVGLDESAMLRGSLLVYLFPLLIMIVFALLADHLIPVASANRDLMVLLAAVLGFGLSLILSNRLLASRANRSRLTPVILRKNIAGS